jgi:hypothetical protein
LSAKFTNYAKHSATKQALPQVSYGRAKMGFSETGVAVVTTTMTLVIGIPVVNDLISIRRIQFLTHRQQKLNS